MNEQKKSVPSPFQQEEVDLLKKHFRDNDELLKAMRAVMLSLEPSESEKQLVKDTFAAEDVYNAVAYRFMPSLSKKVPIGQVQDIWLGIDQQITGQHTDVVKQSVLVHDISGRMVAKAIKLLRDPDGEAVNVAVDSEMINLEGDEMATKLLARNRFVRAIETQLLSLKTTANQAEQPADAGQKNSSR